MITPPPVTPVTRVTQKTYFPSHVISLDRNRFLVSLTSLDQGNRRSERYGLLVAALLRHALTASAA